MLDLCELDKKGLVSCHLRRLWMQRRGKDPVWCARRNELVIPRLLVSILVMFCLILGAVATKAAEPVVVIEMFSINIFMTTVVLMYVVFQIVRGVGDWEESNRFSRLLSEAAGFLQVNPETFGYWGRKEMLATTEKALRFEAELLQTYEKQNRPRREIEDQRRVFKEVHRTFQQLGLAENGWGGYFPSRLKEEPAPAEVKGN